MDTTIIHYPDEKDKKQKKMEDIEEAKRIYMEQMARKEKLKIQNTETIKLKD